eukprot:24725_5
MLTRISWRNTAARRALPTGTVSCGGRMISSVSLDQSLVCDQQAEQLSQVEQEQAALDYQMALAPQTRPLVWGPQYSKPHPCPKCEQPLTLKPSLV